MADRSVFGMLARGLGRLVTKAPVTPVGGPGSSRLLSGYVREPFTGAWQRNVVADPLGAITAFSAVYACVTRIANDIAKLQLQLMRQSEDRTWQPADPNAPHWIPLRTPNSYQNRIQWITFWLISKLLYGNAYCLKVRDARTMVAALYPLDPRRVTPLVTPAGDVYYQLAGDDLSRQRTGITVPASEIIHDRCPTLWHPLVGVSPIYACGVSATQGMRIQANSTALFENMSRPSGMLTAPATIDDITAKRLKDEWQANYGGANLGKLAVLGDGLTYQPMTIPADDAQLIEQLKWTVEDVARAFGMPLYKIGAGPMPTSNNVESLHQQYYSDCLQVHIEAIELCLDEGLAVPAMTGVEFDLTGLLRMDSMTQIDMLNKAVGGALMTPNEGRSRLNLPPLVGGDSGYLQQQNFSLAALAKRDAQPDPFGKQTAPPEAKGEPAEFVMLRAMEDVRVAAERAVRAEQQQREAKQARSAAEAQARAALEQEAAARAEALTAIERAASAEAEATSLREQAMPEPALAQELIRRFATAELVHG